MSEYRIYVRDTQLRRVAELDEFTDLTAIRRHNAGGDWVLRAPAAVIDTAELRWATEGYGNAGIIITRDGETWLSGPMTHLEREDGADGETIEIHGLDDTAVLGSRWAEPCAFPYTTSSHDVQTGPAETLLHTYVSRNALSGVASAGRELYGLVLGVNSGQGTTMTKRARFPNLLEWLQGIAAVDRLGFRVRQTAGSVQRTFETFQPADKTGTVVFSKGLGNVRERTRTEDAATGNYALAAGGGEGTQRAFVARADSENILRYGRWEVFRDQRQTTDTTELSNAAAEVLESGRGRIALTFAPLDTAAIRYGRDYDLGDQVSVEVDGERLAGTVTALRLQLDSNGAVITPTVATSPTTLTPQSGPLAVSRRVSQMERNAEGYTLGMLMAWRRPIASIPSGWQLADGTLSTVDLRGRFVVGVDPSNPLFDTVGEAGGSLTVDLSHTHAGAAHTHSHTHTMGHTHSHSHTADTHTHQIAKAELAHTHSHNHTHNHNHAHNHAMTHDHSHSHGMTHTHSHSHTLVHTHQIDKTELAHTHSHNHTMPHTHAHNHAMDHFHNHLHSMQSHTHQVDLNHNHVSQNTGNATTTQAVASGGGTTVAAVDHVHALDLPALGATGVTSGTPSITNTALDATTASTGITGADSSGASSATTSTDAAAGVFSVPTVDTFGPDTATTSTDASGSSNGITGTDAAPASSGVTGSDSTGVSDALTSTDATAPTYSEVTVDTGGTVGASATGTDATAASASNTGTDATAASAGTTGSAGSVTASVLPPYRALYWIERIV